MRSYVIIFEMLGSLYGFLSASGLITLTPSKDYPARRITGPRELVTNAEFNHRMK